MTEPTGQPEPTGRLICAWCGAIMGVCDTHADSHGICGACYARVEKQLRGVLTHNSIASFKPGLAPIRRKRP